MSELKIFSEAFTIDSFRQNFVNGARNYLFYVVPTFPAGLTGVNNLKPNPSYLVRSSSIPARTVEAHDLSWQGYSYKLGGKSTFADWSVVFTVDKTADLYTKFIEWTNLVHNPTTNEYGDPSEYMSDQSVQLLSLDGKSAILDIKLIGCWASDVTELSLDYAGSEVLSFTVTFKILRVEHINSSGKGGSLNA